MDERAMPLHSVGIYLDRVAIEGDGARFEERVVM
jgi:hypothetical protein